MELNSKNQTILITDRLPPQALDVERIILGSMLIDGDACNCAMELLNEGCFYSTANQRIFLCIKEMYGKNLPIDVITIADTLKKKEWLESVGNEMYLVELAENIATSGNIEYYAGILIEKATLRQLITVASKITTDCFDTEKDSKIVLESAESSIFNIAEARTKNNSRGIYTQQVLTGETFRLIDLRRQGKITGIMTGFPTIDSHTGGFQNSDLIIIAGRPSSGKTAFAVNLARNMGIAGVPVALFELEMSAQQVNERLLSGEAEVNSLSMKTGTLTISDSVKLGETSGIIAELPLYIDDNAELTIGALWSKTRMMIRKYGIKAIIVDYIQLMKSDVAKQSRSQEVSEITRGLKLIAKSTNIPVIALSQLSRQNEQRADHEPQLSDLRDSGSIEQDADMVMFVHRECLYGATAENKDKASIIVRKQRNGDVGSIKMFYKSFCCKFIDPNTKNQHDPSLKGWE